MFKFNFKIKDQMNGLLNNMITEIIYMSLMQAFLY